MFCPFSFVVDSFTALAAEVLLTTFAKNSFLLIWSFFTFLADKLDFGMVGGVRGVALGAADVLALQAPKGAFRLFIALFAFDSHNGLRGSRIYIMFFICLFIQIPSFHQHKHTFSRFPFQISFSELFSKF